MAQVKKCSKDTQASDKYGADRIGAAPTKAKAYSIYIMRRIENILKNGVENMHDEKEVVPDKGIQLRFLCEGSSFNHYKN